MQILTSAEVANLQHGGILLPEPFGRWLGPVFRGVQLFVWGAQGSGKSTLSAILARMFAEFFGPTVYVSAEEHLSKTVTDRINRLGVAHPSLYVATFSGMCSLRDALREIGAAAVVLDSISKADPHSAEGEDFLSWCRAEGISVILVAHATKARTYRGESTLPHEVDVVIRAQKGDDDGEHYASWTFAGGKNRLGGDPEADPIVIPMSADEVPTPDVRRNPVPVPFHTTIGEVLGRHKVRSVKRLQALIADKTMCLPTSRRYVHDAEPGPLGVRYTRDSKRGESQLDVLAGKQLVATICAASFRACLRRLAEDYGDTELVITDQRHAKLVLGAREYARQERAAEAEVKRDRTERLKKANAVAKKSGSKKPSADACSAAASELAEKGTARAGRVLRPCDEVKTGSSKPASKRAAKPKRKKSSPKRSSSKPKARKKSMKRALKKSDGNTGNTSNTGNSAGQPSGDAAVLDALQSIKEGIEAL